MRIALPLLPLLLLAGCGGGDGNSGNSGAAAEKVAAVAAPAGTSWVETVSITPEGGYRMGNPDAVIKLVEYGSRTCPTCGQFGRDSVPALADNYVASGKVSFEFRDFAVHGAPDLAAALLGRCGGTGPFFPILDQMYANQNAMLEKLQSTPEAFNAQVQQAAPAQAISMWAQQLGLIDFVKQRGIPEAKARQCLADQKGLEALVKITEDAADKVTGTPSFFLNGTKVDAVNWTQVEAALRDAGA
ncbi:DsbA family protein [Sphingomonas sp. 3-13AW]|jgi:protein-disulfide isomerase|uniref:DsbA family protein n=1 Tax=Sphingomonas sp. 3-13AW TaxID=3050450 RepID=UPI003BB7BBBC